MNENKKFPTVEGETGRRTTRNAAHVGFPTVFIVLALEFQWVVWTPKQVLAVEAVAIFVLATLHNLAESLGWIRDQRTPETT